jgi:hypothetical protein
VSDVGRRITWVVVGAVAILAMAAAVEAMRGEDSSAPSEARRSAPPPTTTQPVAVEQALAEEGVGGVLYYTNENCELRAVELPSLHPAPTPVWDECRFSLSPDARTVRRADAAMTSPPVSLREGAVVEAETGRVLVPARALRRALHEDPDIPPGTTRFLRLRHIKEAAWLDETRLVAVLATEQASGPPQDFVGVFEGPRVVRIVRGLGWLFSDLRASPRGSFFVVRATNGAGFVLFRRDGGPAPTPPVTGYRAIAWSPDERWAALATRASVYVFRPGFATLRLRRLELTARDLAWRYEAASATAPTGVGSGPGGVIYYTDARCNLQALRFPELSRERAPRWDECRFSLAPRGRGVAARDTAWAPSGESSASESEGRVNVSRYNSSGSATQGASLAGSAPAFRPDGTLSFFYQGALRVLDRACLPVPETVDRCSRVLLRPAALRRLALLHPSAPDDPSPGVLREVVVKGHAWLDEERVVLLMQLDVLAAGRFEHVVVLEGTRVVDVVPASGGRLTGLRVSPRGRYFAVQTEDPDGVLLFDRDGTGLPLPPLTRPRAIAWSPGEEWTALATPASVYVFRTGASSPLVRRLGLRAGDIAWRSN